MAALTGTGVLVTRPLEQSQSLCALLEREGARIWRLPVIGIHPLAPEPSRGAFDLLIFTSANAVRCGASLIVAGAPLAAIGPATARALEQAGHAAVRPGRGFDSESLLALPQLQDLAGQRVLLVKGRGGRALLEEELQRRGAQVHAAIVYERRPVPLDAALLDALERHAAARELHAVTATSVEIGMRLLEALPSPLRDLLQTVLWVVPTARVAEALAARGLRAPVRVARSAEDQDLVAALIEARGSSFA